MIFFNEEGNEAGGLIFNGFRVDSSFTAVGHLSFDQWKQNQVVALQYLDNRRTRRAGMRVWDRPTDVTMDQQLDLLMEMRDASEAERDSLRAVAAAAREAGDFGTERLFVGSQDRTARLELRDTKRRVRVRLLVDDEDVARLEFLDESGGVVAGYPSLEG
jgi:hypothetical protein